MAIHKTESIVLARRDIRETSYLVGLFTQDFGKITAQAKGARRKTGKFGTQFLPLSHNMVIFYERYRSGLHIIAQADLLENFDAVSRSLGKLACASYCLELVNAAMPADEANGEVFRLLLNLLHFLNKEDKIKHIAQFFEIKFLALSGFKPRFDGCVHCGAPLARQSRFSYVLGGLLCPGCFRADETSRELMPGTIASINHIEKIPIEKMPNFSLLDGIGRELRRVLRSFIDFHVAAEFKSLEFVKKMRSAHAGGVIDG